MTSDTDQIPINYEPDPKDEWGEMKRQVLEALIDGDTLNKKPLSFAHICDAKGIKAYTGYKWRESDQEFDKAVRDIERIGRAHRADFAQDKLGERVNANDLKAIEIELGANARDRGYGRDKEPATVNIAVGITPEQIAAMSTDDKLARMRVLMDKAEKLERCAVVADMCFEEIKR